MADLQQKASPAWGLDTSLAGRRDTPEWWLLRLGTQLAADRPRFDRLEAYWSGNPPLPTGNARMRDAYKRLQRMSRTNFNTLIAEAVLERLKVIGFRAGADASEDADKEAWKWWQKNHLDADAGLVHRAAVVLSRSYVIVGDDPDDEEMPLITVEDPRSVIHECSPTNRRKVIAALKTWYDPGDNVHFAVLYLPDTIHYFRTLPTSARPSDIDNLWKPERWTPDTQMTPDGSAPNPDGVVPVVPFINRPSISGTSGLGEFEDIIDILDRINTVILDRLVISAMQAYRQRWGKGIKTTDEHGNDIGSFDPGADLLWTVEDENAVFGEFGATDLTPIIKAIESDVQYLSAITRTPPHYILAGIVNASGDALSVAETGLTSKVEERQVELGESWELVYALVELRRGRKVAEDAEVLWKNAQFRSLTERAAAALQLSSAGVPWRTRMRMLDFTPQEIERMDAERMEDALHNAMMQPLLNPQLGMGAPVGAPGASVDPSPTAPTPPGDAGGISGTRASSSPGSGSSSSGTNGRGTKQAGANSGKEDEDWDVLYQRARASGVKNAYAMSITQLKAALGGG